ncbi:hypothetical protein CCP4SC76_1960008 [Gammaproteobacteria bacterium]
MAQIYPNSWDHRVRRALEVIKRPDRGDGEMRDAFHDARAHVVETYSVCGKEFDFPEQASHFVATALAEALNPVDQIGNNLNIAWRAAMQARIAKDFELMEQGAGDVDSESERQYRLVEAFLNHKS